MNTLTAAVPAAPDPEAPHGAVRQGIHALSLAELRALRRRLQEEAAQADYWHRLARARLDLTVAVALIDGEAAQRDPAVSPSDDDGPSCHQPAPCFSSLRELLLGQGLDGYDVAERLHRIDDAERLLRGYGSSVRACADEATLELVRRYSQEPATCLDAVRSPG